MCKITVRPSNSSLVSQQYAAAQQLAMQQMHGYQQQQTAAAAATAASPVNKSLETPTRTLKTTTTTKDEMMVQEIVSTPMKQSPEFIEKVTPAPASSSSTSSAAVAASAVEKTNKKMENDRDASSSLQALLTMCMPNKPAVRPGALIRESLLGQVRLGDFTLPSGECMPIVIKEFNMNQVLSKRSKQGKQLYEDALAELQIHAYISKQKSKHSIGLYGLYLDSNENKLYAYLECAAKGELFSLLQQSASEISLPQAANYFIQLMQGLNELHSINIVHRDLSLENVLLTADDQVKICDFGLATVTPPGQLINDGLAIGKLKYMSPEIYYRESYDPRLCDVWASGVILFVLMTGVFPYESPSAEDPRLLHVCNGQINDLLAHWKRSPLDAEALDLFSHIFCPPTARWTAQQILNHPFCLRYIMAANQQQAAAQWTNTNAAFFNDNNSRQQSVVGAAVVAAESSPSMVSAPSISVGGYSTTNSPISSHPSSPLSFRDTSYQTSSATHTSHESSDDEVAELSGQMAIAHMESNYGSCVHQSNMLINQYHRMHYSHIGVQHAPFA